MTDACRLFVAVDLPDELRPALAAWIPDGPGLRPSHPDDLHLTLHFIGNGDAAACALALECVQASPFRLTFQGPGRFIHPGGGQTLWMGVEVSDGLRTLHRLTGEALSPTGFRPERRPYSPHITLGRARRGLPDGEFDQWLARPWLGASGFVVTRFSLFSTRPVPGGPRYHREREFSLESGGQTMESG